MKLTEIKKLKVPELRSRLKELGLDIKGLKAELIGRLWSALEAGQSVEDGEEEPKPQNDTSVTPAAQTEIADVRAQSSSTPTEAGVTARCKLDRTREFTDCATQTETDTGLPTPQQSSDLISDSVPEYQAEPGYAERPGEGQDRRAQSSEERARGRAFYEFKEEIRYKR